VTFVRKTSIIASAKQKEYSFTRYAIRVKKDARLHDDIVDYISKHDTSLQNLVDKLLGNHFSSLSHIDL
jgi:hypothetical protein